LRPDPDSNEGTNTRRTRESRWSLQTKRIRGALLAARERIGNGENVVASRLGLDPTRGPRKLEKSLAHEQD
jgi:hypothetical protein